MQNEEQSVQLLSEVDILRALRNSYLERMIISKLHVAHYKRRIENLKNGDSLNMLKGDLKKSEENIESNQSMLDCIDDALNKIENSPITLRVTN